jgi:hypothetical protein
MLILKNMNEGSEVQGIQLNTYAVCMFDLNMLCYVTWAWYKTFSANNLISQNEHRFRSNREALYLGVRIVYGA